MIIFHHNDADGRCAGAIAYRYFKNSNPRVLEVDYYTHFPLEHIGNGESVIIVDFDLQHEGEWIELLHTTMDIIWIDHHKTSIENTGPQSKLRGVRSDKHSAAKLTWNFFYQYDDAPLAVELVSDYDTWTHKDERSMYFVRGLSVEDHKPTSPLWQKLLSDDTQINRIVENGKVIVQSEENINEEYINRYGFEASFEGYQCYCCNRGMSGSTLFHSLNRPYDIVIPFCFDGKIWQVSLYSTTVDVSAIAKKYGGGGHKGAAGFMCATLPFRMKR